VPIDETNLIQSMCRMVGNGLSAQVTIVPAELPDDEGIRQLQSYALSHGAVLRIDNRGGIVIQGGEPKKTSAAKPAAGRQSRSVLTLAPNGATSS
jgi:hypothetical protein